MSNLPQRLAGALRQPLVQDALLAVVLSVLAVVSLWNPPPVAVDFRDPGLGAVAIVVTGSASVLLRSRHPVAALVVSLAALVAVVQLGYSQTLAGLPSLLNLYAVASRRSIRPALAWGLVTVASVSTVLVTGPIEPTTGDWIANALVLVTGWSLGRSMRSRRAQLASALQRDDALATAAEAELRARIVRERAEVAQEVQDLVAHSLTEITVQVAAARRLVQSAPDVAAQMLAEVESSGRDATEEMRRLFRLMADGGRPAGLRPMPGLAALEDLARAEEAAGREVSVTSTGEPTALGQGKALTAYRIVEEVLEHARTHRWAEAVDVALEWTAESLTITVSGREPAPLGWDRGLGGGPFAALARRTAVYGGTLRWGRRAGGAFAVTATLPRADAEDRSDARHPRGRTSADARRTS